MLEFLSARSDRQREAFEAIKAALAAYDVECIDTLIGDIQPPAELMKTQTDRKIAEELQRTYEVQRAAQVKRQQLERETSVANMQGEVVRSEQMVAISEKNALAVVETARGEATRVKLAAEAEAHARCQRAESEATATRLNGDAEAEATAAIGTARAEAYRVGVAALGSEAFTSVQLAGILGEHHVKLVPDIAVGGGESSGLASVMMAKLLQHEPLALKPLAGNGAAKPGV